MSEPIMKPTVCQRWLGSQQPSLFGKGGRGRRALTMPQWDGEAVDTDLPADALRAEPADLPDLSEPEVMRHFTLLSNLNHHIERGMYPLGSCTMKYNPRLNEQVAALPRDEGGDEVHCGNDDQRHRSRQVEQLEALFSWGLAKPLPHVVGSRPHAARA